MRIIAEKHHVRLQSHLPMSVKLLEQFSVVVKPTRRTSSPDPLLIQN
jgi:hypothetical protein